MSAATVATLVDTQAAAAAVRRPGSTIRRWKHENRLTARGTDRKGRTLFDLVQVHAVDKQMRGSR